MNKILEKVEKHELSPIEAFEKIYGNKPIRAHFIFLRLNVFESPLTSIFINILFFLPVPIFLGKILIKKFLKKNNLPTTLYRDFILTLGGTRVKVKSREANVSIKLF
jgi:hypothetical protein